MSKIIDLNFFGRYSLSKNYVILSTPLVGVGVGVRDKKRNLQFEKKSGNVEKKVKIWRKCLFSGEQYQNLEKKVEIGR